MLPKLKLMTQPAALQDYNNALAQHLVPSALADVANYLYQNKISLKITRERTSKLGDYAAPSAIKHHGHRITINHNLDKNTFLWVILHEIAHYQVFVNFGKHIKPHGAEFQKAFAYNLRFFNEKHCFPAETETLIREYHTHLPLKKTLERQIELIFRDLSGEKQQTSGVTLDTLPENTIFCLKGRIFKKLETRRTRCKCLCINNNRQYTVLRTAIVQPVSVEKMK